MEPLPAVSLKLIASPSLVHDRAGLENTAVDMQNRLFQDLGVLCPLPIVEEDNSFVSGTWQLELNGAVRSPVFTVDEGSIVEIAERVESFIRGKLGALLSEELIEYYLSSLSTEFPALIAAVRQEFGVTGLTKLLVERLNAYGSIRNLPLVLEDLLRQHFV